MALMLSASRTRWGLAGLLGVGALAASALWLGIFNGSSGGRADPATPSTSNTHIADLARNPLPETCPGPAELRLATAPPYAPGTKYADQVEAARQYYWASEESPLYALQDYTTAGDYLNYGAWNRLTPTPNFQYDANGFPMVRYGGVFYHVPVNVADYALIRYGQALRGEAPNSEFLRVADFLVTLQDSRGAFVYPFPFPYYITGEVLPAGWTSGMAQGMGMSVLARAYLLTGDPAYLAAGDAALRFLLVPEGPGGPAGDLRTLDPSLGHLISLKEFPSHPDYYTLNGFMYTMLGLYDWSQLTRADQEPSATARATFERALETLLYTLPYYDVGGFSAYDLGHVIEGVRPNLQESYHNIHIYLLHALYSVTGAQRLQCFEELWHSYVRR